MATNRWGIDVRKDAYVTCHHPRGGAVSGRVTRIYTMQGYGKRIDLDGGGSFGLDDVFKVEPPPPAFYVTTYCNHAHRMKDGKPMAHECYVLPPEALAAERRGETDIAIGLLQAAHPMRRHTGVRELKTFKLVWSPTGQTIATGIKAVTPRSAIRQATAPYRKALGEIYATEE